MLAGRSAQAAGCRNATVAAVAVAVLFVLAGMAQAAVPIGSDFRVSQMGADGITARGAADSAVAYNSKDNEYLVVWYGDGEATDDEFEIYGQRVNAATGSEIGGDFRISDVPGGSTHGALSPAVAYNSTDNEYLIAWEADGLATDDELEIFGQRLSAAGGELGSDFRISNVGTDTDATRDAEFPAVAYNSTANDYLVVWEADGLATEGELEIFGQLVSAAGAEVGTDFRISDVGPDGNTARFADHAAIAYSSQSNEYLVAWEGNDLAQIGELEIFGQVVSAAGAEVVNDFRISNVGNNNDQARDAQFPAATYNSQANEYLVAWQGNGLAAVGELEIFGQRVSSAGTEAGSDFRISNVGTDGDPSRFAESAAAAYQPTVNEYLVVWDGDGLSTDDEIEIFGQRISSGGGEVGSDFRVSSVGSDGDTERGAFAAAVASSSQADAGLVTWYGDGLATNNEFEIFGHRLGVAPSTTPPATPPGSNPTTPTELRLSVRAARFQRALRRRVLTLRVTCNVRCRITATTRVSVPRTRASRTFRLRAVRRTLAPSRTTTVRVKLTRNVVRAARRALKKRKRVTARVNVTARDDANARRSVRRTIRIRR